MLIWTMLMAAVMISSHTAQRGYQLPQTWSQLSGWLHLGEHFGETLTEGSCCTLAGRQGCCQCKIHPHAAGAQHTCPVP